jgi:DnaD/phage-associated family protein
MSREVASARIDLTLLDALLARTQDAAEIKLVLQVLRLAAGTGSPLVPVERLVAPASVSVVVGDGSPEPGETRVLRALERALADGLLYRVAVHGDGEREFVLPATAENGRLLMELRTGRADAGSELGLPEGDEIVVHRPNVFSLYERHVGPLTPLVAEHLREAERAYPRDWLEQAILQSAEYNARTWRYIETILRRWEAEGGPTPAVR